MVQIAIEPFVSIRAVRELLSKVMPERKYIDKDMINNVMIRVRKKRIDLAKADIFIDPKQFDTSFITTYRNTSDNYTECKFLIAVLLDLFS